MKISKTTLPDKPFKNYGDWMKWLNKQDLTAEEKFEANFMRIWEQFKADIKNERER
tara:strand:+ start:1078 stop:1245 length:168 start_codon:yes stop_codon:yes gene_type:complete